MSKARELATIGISNTNTVKINHTDVTDDEYARFTAQGLESMSTAEVLADLDQNLSDFVATHTLPSTSGATGQFLKLSSNSGQMVWDDIVVPTLGIANTNTVKIDSTTVADNDYAKFTSTGLEGRDFSQVKTDLSLNNVENTALSTWGGSTAIVTVGALAAGSINWTGTINTGSGAITSTGNVTGGVVNATSTLQIGGVDTTTMFATATQGSTADSAIQPSTSPTLTNLTLAGSAGAGYLRGPATLTIDPSPHDDIAGTVIVKGSLQVDGTTTTINSTVKSIADLDMVLASGATNSAQSNGAGIIVGDFTGNPSILYTDSTTSWDFNKNIITTGTVTANGGNSTNWNSAYTTSTTAILDADFSTNGLMSRTGAGAYNIVTDNSSNWNTAHGWGNHSSQGYLTASSSATLTNKGGNISQWTNDSGYISTTNYVPISSPTFTGDVTVQTTNPKIVIEDTDANSAYASVGELIWRGKDAGNATQDYARITGNIGTSATDGSEEGRMYFGRAVSNGTMTNVMWLQEQNLGLGDEQTITWYDHKGTTYECTLDWATPSAANTITFPDASGTVALFDSNADLNFGDNDKVIFGAGSDLKIYSDGGGAVFETQGQSMDAFRFTKVNDGMVGASLYFDHQSATPSTVDATTFFSFNKTDTSGGGSSTLNVGAWYVGQVSTKFSQYCSGSSSVDEFLVLDGSGDKLTIKKNVTLTSDEIIWGSVFNTDALLDVAGDLTIDADGSNNIILKDATAQFAAFTNSSGNLIIKSGTTTAATFSGADVTFAGRVGIGTSSPDANNFGAGAGILAVASDTGSAKTAMLNLIGDGNDTDGTRVASLFYNDASAVGAGATLAGIEAYRASNHATDPGANLLFNTNSSGGAYSEKMRITSGGDVTVTGGTLSVTTNSATGGTDTANALEIYKSGETTVSQNVLVYSDANGYSNGWCINMDENTGGSVTRQSNSYKSLFYFQDIRTTSSPNEKHNFGEWDGTNFKPLCYMYTSTDGTDDDASNVEVLASGANSTNANAWLNIRSKGTYYGGLNYYSGTTHIGSILGYVDASSNKELRTYIGGSGTFPQANGTYVTRIKTDGTFVIKTNLGIGEDSPDYPLHITHSNPVVKLEADGNNDRGIRLYGGTTEKASILWNEGNANFFFKNYRTDANISYANIGFFTGGGTYTTPALRLNINYAGAIGFSQSGNTTSTNQDPNNMEYGSSGQVLTSNGNTSPPTWQTASSDLVNDQTPQLGGELDLNGSSFTNANGTTSWNSGGSTHKTFGFGANGSSYAIMELYNSYNAGSGEQWRTRFIMSGRDAGNNYREIGGIYGVFGNNSSTNSSSWGFHEFYAKDGSVNRAYMRGHQGGVSIERGLYVGSRSVIPTDNEVRAEGNITAYYSSDKRLKENIKPLEDALTKIQSINGVEFDWTDEDIEKRGGADGYFVRKHDVGVIAQEVEEVMPEVVATRKDGYKAVNYEKLVPLLIQAVKEQQSKIEILEERLDGLTK